MKSLFLITRPLYDLTTFYLYHWSKLLTDFAVLKGYKVIDLKKERVNYKEFVGVIKKTNPRLVMLNGHGGSNHIKGQNGETLIQTNQKENILISKVVYVLACATAKHLGVDCISRGTISYIGYQEDFIFLSLDNHLNNPIKDEVAKLFFEPSNHIIISLFKGHPTGDAMLRSKQMYLKIIQKLITSSSSKSYLVRYLLWDMQHLACLGDREARI